MKGYLVDTNVISERKDAAIVAWLDRASPLLWLSAITAAEVESGIARKRREGAQRQADDLTRWWDAVVHLYGDRILPFDRVAAAIAGRQIDAARASGHNPGFADIAIASIAAANELTVLTRNLRHFQPLGVACHDPYVSLLPLPDAI